MKKLLLVLMLVTTVARAETFSWTDREGTVHFVESLGQVPADYRKGAKALGIDTKGTTTENKAAGAVPPGRTVADRGSALPDVEGLKERMLNDEGIMALIYALQSDPEMQALLADPAILGAVQSGDVGALKNNPAFLQLLDNPRIRQIEKKLQNGAK